MLVNDLGFGQFVIGSDQVVAEDSGPRLVNDGPTINALGLQITDEDTSYAISGVSIADDDASEGTGLVRVTLRTANGTVGINPDVSGGVVASQIIENNTPAVANVVVVGTVLTLALRDDAFGQTTITVAARDQNGATVQDTFVR